MTSLFSRLQKHNKEATMKPLEVLQAYVAGNGYEVLGDAVVPMRNEEAEAALAAVLNLIEAAQRAVTTRDVFESGTDDDTDSDELFHAWQEAMDVLREAVAVFVSGQEEPK